VLSAVYSRRPPRRPASGLEQHRAKRRNRPFRLAELGAWVTRKSQEPRAVAPIARAGKSIPLVVRAAATLTWPDEPAPSGSLPLEWLRLIAAGHPDPRDPHSGSADELHRMAAPLVRQAFAARAGPRDRIVLVTSALPAEGRTFVAISFALSLARARPVLLVDADPGPTGGLARFASAPTEGLSEALADPTLGPDRLVVRTELDRLALLGPGAPRTDLLRLLASGAWCSCCASCSRGTLTACS
jgi:hypothetical protein